MGIVFLALVIVAGILGVEWIRANKREGPAAPAVEPERLERLETALSGLESRLDDLQDQQRFLERLLEERPAPAALPPSEREGSREPGAAPSQGSAPDPSQESILFDTERGGE